MRDATMAAFEHEDEESYDLTHNLNNHMIPDGFPYEFRLPVFWYRAVELF